MKGQFFVMATVIMILTLMALIRYFYDFSDINLPKLKEISELNYIPSIKETLIDTINSYNGDCNKLQDDLTFTKDFLENKMIGRGIKTKIDYQFSCPPPDISFNFTIKTSNIYTETIYSMTPPVCGDGICEWRENCPPDSSSCPEPPVCYLRTCDYGCNNPADLISAGLQDNNGINLCNAVQGCGSTPCECNGFGNCVSGAPPPPPP